MATAWGMGSCCSRAQVLVNCHQETGCTPEHQCGCGGPQALQLHTMQRERLPIGQQLPQLTQHVCAPIRLPGQLPLKCREEHAPHHCIASEIRDPHTLGDMHAVPCCCCCCCCCRDLRVAAAAAGWCGTAAGLWARAGGTSSSHPGLCGLRLLLLQHQVVPAAVDVADDPASGAGVNQQHSTVCEKGGQQRQQAHKTTAPINMAAVPGVISMAAEARWLPPIT
jgi:hypothetical protein